ncbi:hypothetical protein K1719_044235 [Acacia pycnantha]|nr:hypothetical protein K1719_044235 [Acacia pycnantha]
MAGRRDVLLAREKGQSNLGSRIFVAVVIGVLLGCVFAFLVPHGFVSSNRLFHDRRIEIPDLQDLSYCRPSFHKENANSGVKGTTCCDRVLPSTGTMGLRRCLSGWTGVLHHEIGVDGIQNSDPIVFYRVQVGLQSPEGITTVHGVLRRFNDFLKLFADRRCSLEEWMTKLLSDIDVSRCAAVASFLELKATARASFRDSSQ